MAVESEIQTAPAEAVVNTAEEIVAALKEYEQAFDRVAVVKKFPFLVPILNNPTK